MTTVVRVSRDRIAAVAGLLAPPSACAVLVPVRGSFPNTDAVLVLVAVAASGRRAGGLLAAAGAAVVRLLPDQDCRAMAGIARGWSMAGIVTLNHRKPSECGWAAIESCKVPLAASDECFASAT